MYELTELEREFRRLRRECGYTLQQISNIYHVSPSRVHQILLRAAMKIERADRGQFGFPPETPTRVYNALMRAGYRCPFDLAGLSFDDLMRIRNIGIKSAEWIRDNFSIRQETRV